MESRHERASREANRVTTQETTTAEQAPQSKMAATGHGESKMAASDHGESKMADSGHGESKMADNTAALTDSCSSSCSTLKDTSGLESSAQLAQIATTDNQDTRLRDLQLQDERFPVGKLDTQQESASGPGVPVQSCSQAKVTEGMSSIDKLVEEKPLKSGQPELTSVASECESEDSTTESQRDELEAE